jgi:hypothetical protein
LKSDVLTDRTPRTSSKSSFDLVIEEGKAAKEAALMTGINIKTTQHYMKKCDDDDENACLSV